MIQNNAKAAFTSASIHNLNAVIQGSLTSSTIESLNTRNSSNSAALYNSPANPSYTSVVDIRTVPSLLNPVAKGQKIPLSSFSAEGLDVRLGWNVKNSVCDIDVSAFLLSRQGKVPGDDWFVFYGQPQSPGSLRSFFTDKGSVGQGKDRGSFFPSESCSGKDLYLS